MNNVNSKSITEMYNQIYNRNKKIPIVEDVNPSVSGMSPSKGVARAIEDDYIQVLAKRVR